MSFSCNALISTTLFCIHPLGVGSEQSKPTSMISAPAFENPAFRHIGLEDESNFAYQRIKLRMRGIKFETCQKAALKYPETLLSKVVSEKRSFYNPATDEFIFDRDPFIFNSILNFYCTGHLHFQHNMCRQEVQKELEFWEIDETTLSPCCWVWFVQKETMQKRCEAVSNNALADDEEAVATLRGLKKTLYLLLEKPNSSPFAYVSGLLILSLH